MVRTRRRDRRGRGLRGPLAPPQVPLSRTRAEAFDDLVLDAVERLERRWAAQLEAVEFAVEDVPAAEVEQLGEALGDGVPLARLHPAERDRPARIVLHRWPIESRAKDPHERAELVHDL